MTMTYRLPGVAAAVLLAASMGLFATAASAMPLGGALVLKNAAPATVETVRWRRGFGGLGAGLVGGAIIGGMLAAPGYGYYEGPYGGPGPGDAVAYCMQRFRSYDPASGTYLGNDGRRHSCP